MALQHPDHRDPAVSRYREMTVAAVVLGVAQGVILNIAFIYIALKLGFSLGGSAISSIIGYVVLRGLLHKGSTVENNINQTIASAINSSGTGVVFVLPGLFLLSAENPQIPIAGWVLLAASIGGAVLGVVLIIPLRRQFIEVERLRFPTGIAVASIIRSGSAGAAKVRLLLFGFAFSALWKLLLFSGWLDYPGVLDGEMLDLSFGLLPDYLLLTLLLSPLTFAAGLLTGRSGLPFFIGGVIAWWVISPTAVTLGWLPQGLSGVEQSEFLHQAMLRPLGIGVLIGAAFMELFLNLPMLKAALHSVLALRDSRRSATPRDELPAWLLLLAGLLALLFFFFAAWATPGVAFYHALLVAVFGVAWMGLAALIVTQSTGLTDISPISGMALVSMALMMLLLNGNVAAAMLITIGVSVAVGQAADMMQDLKTGFLVGSRPFLQQLAQLSVSWLGALLAFGVIYLLWQGGGGFGPGTDLPAPQAGAISSIVSAVQQDNVPSDKFAFGALLGVLLGAAPLAGLGVLAGLAMYLPFSITLGYGIGCLIHIGLLRRHGYVFVENKLVPLAAGLIIGDALLSVAYAVYQVLLRGA